MENKISKLRLKKEVVAKLNKDEMLNIIGGKPITVQGTCGNQCAYVNVHPGDPTIVEVTRAYCASFPDDPFNNTCRFDAPANNYCGSDYNPSCVGPCD